MTFMQSFQIASRTYKIAGYASKLTLMLSSMTILKQHLSFVAEDTVLVGKGNSMFMILE